MGGLSLKNIQIVDDGMLEIVNRGFAKIYSGNGHSVATNASGEARTSAKLQPIGVAFALSSIDLSSTIADTSALSVATNVKGLFINPADGIAACNRTFVQPINLMSPNKDRNDKLSVGVLSEGATTAVTLESTTNTFNVAAFERKNYGVAANQVFDPTIITDDVSAVRGDNGANFIRNSIPQSFSPASPTYGTGMMYANTLSSIEVENCNGPLYIRGFCVDGVSGADATYENSVYKAETGISVNNLLKLL